MNNNELMHYGTQGMKWGRRKRPDGGYETSDAQPAGSSNRSPMNVVRNQQANMRRQIGQDRARALIPAGFPNSSRSPLQTANRNAMGMINSVVRSRIPGSSSNRSPMNVVRNQQANMRRQIGQDRARAIMDRFASAPSANERVMNRYNQMQANRRRLQGTNAPGKATAEYYKNKNGGNKFSKSSLGGTSGKISDRRLRNWVAGRAQEISNPGANPEIVNRLEADKVRRARRRRR